MVPRSRSAAPLIGAVVFGLGLFVTDLTMSVQFFPRGGSWSPQIVVLLVTQWSAIALGLAVGCWWWWRAPANPTGRLLYAAAVGQGLWLLAFCWPYSQGATLLRESGYVVAPALALVVLGWPTGRASRRLVRVVIAVVACAFAISLVAGLFTRSAIPSEQWPDPPYAIWSVPAVWYALDPIQALVFGALPAVAAIVWLVRRERAVPPAVRPLLTPITVSGILAAGSIVVLHVGLQLFPVSSEGSWDGGWAGTVFLMGLYFLPGWVALGVLVAGNRRRRAVAVGQRSMVVDLESAVPVVTPSASVAAIFGDPTATVRYRGPDRGWVDPTGSAMADPAGGRRLLPVVDEEGGTVAAIEIDGSRTLPPLLIDLGVSTIALRAADERATALADARRREVVLRSRELVAAADAGRSRLEHDLHDGAQQLLVGLALTVGLRARAAASGDRATLAGDIRTAGQEVLTVLDAAGPAALSLGLSGALRSLAAVHPTPVTVRTVGDLPPDDPAAVGLYLAAAELVTNAAKHAGATGIDIELTVEPGGFRLSVRDDGIGGLPAVPAAVLDRVRTLGGDAQVASPVGRGTTVDIWVDTRVRVGGAA